MRPLAGQMWAEHRLADRLREEGKDGHHFCTIRDSMRSTVGSMIDNDIITGEGAGSGVQEDKGCR